jgi:hypothetical protein
VPVDHDLDRYPNIYDVLATLQHSADLPNVPIEKVEVTCLANGELNCRWWEARAEEPDFVHYSDPLLG